MRDWPWIPARPEEYGLLLVFLNNTWLEVRTQKIDRAKVRSQLSNLGQSQLRTPERFAQFYRAAVTLAIQGLPLIDSLQVTRVTREDITVELHACGGNLDVLHTACSAALQAVEKAQDQNVSYGGRAVLGNRLAKAAAAYYYAAHINQAIPPRRRAGVDNTNPARYTRRTTINSRKEETRMTIDATVYEASQRLDAVAALLAGGDYSNDTLDRLVDATRDYATSCYASHGSGRHAVIDLDRHIDMMTRIVKLMWDSGVGPSDLAIALLAREALDRARDALRTRMHADPAADTAYQKTQGALDAATSDYYWCDGDPDYVPPTLDGVNKAVGD